MSTPEMPMAEAMGPTIDAFAARVKATLRAHDMVRPGHRLLVAVSGGADSSALLDVLVRLAPEGGFDLCVAHFNHCLRGAEADADEAHVRDLAAGYGLPFVAGRGDVSAAAREMGRGVEAAARRLRNDFLKRAAGERRCRGIALGHTASDRVETFLLHLLRGTGLAGLRGMRPVRRPFLRPLIGLWREEVEAYCLAAGLSWRTDSSNLDTSRFLRNKIRHELLPALDRDYRPGAARALLRAAESVDLDLAWTESAVQDALAGASAEAGAPAEAGPSAGAGGDVRLSLPALRDLPEGLLLRVLRAAAEGLPGGVYDWEWEHFASLARAVRAGRTGQRVSLPGGLEGRVAYGWLELGPAAAEQPDIAPRPLPVPGVVAVPEAGVEVRARVCRPSEAPPRGPAVAVLSARLADALTVRGWRPGDRFQPLGMKGHKKLQDFFVDEKVPRRRRRTVPLVIHRGEGIIWVAGMRVAENARAELLAEVVLVLELAPCRAGGEGRGALDGEV